jgi:hypothetical protein
MTGGVIQLNDREFFEIALHFLCNMSVAAAVKKAATNTATSPSSRLRLRKAALTLVSTLFMSLEGLLHWFLVYL